MIKLVQHIPSDTTLIATVATLFTWDIAASAQNIGKSEPPAHLRFNTYRYGITSTKGLLFDKHFNQPGHSFNEHACFTIIEQVYIANNNKDVTGQLWEDCKYFWMYIQLFPPQTVEFNTPSWCYQKKAKE